MESKILTYPNLLKLTNHNHDNKNQSSGSSDVDGIIFTNEKVLKDHILLRMQEMEEMNIHLERLVELQKKKLIEMAATNIKFVSIIAHDLRGPFSSILGVLELLRESLTDYDVNEIDKFVSIASDSANRTLTLLNNLLTWTFSQNKEKTFEPVKVNLYEVVEYEMESIRVPAAQKQIKVSHSIPTGLNLTADLQMVKTILRNLLNNAVKFTNLEGTIRISAKETAAFIEISVKDNGIGISAKTRHNLFKMDEFQSIAGTSNEKGTGLGLLLCKEFVEIHGGNIWVESAPGKGSEFKFTMPHYI
jgi:signal transduction histidine kinase